MKVLIIGSGGREHALAWKLSQEAEVFCAPGNPGTAQVGMNFAIKADDQGALVELCDQIEPDLVVVGPEDPLIAGLADRLRAGGYTVFGPGAEAAQLEGSKAFAKAKMREAGVPCGRSETFTEFAPSLALASELAAAGGGVVIKASGPAKGKGVVVCETLAEAEEALTAMLVEGDFGASGATVVVEERLDGPEFSLLSVCNGQDFVSLPVAQDYKRILEGDRGPNTGGMGTYSPVAWVTPELIRLTEERVVAPILALTPGFRGVLFSGLMVVDGEPKCLEYNVRFGDPETQSVMRRLGTGFLDLLLAAARGEPLPPIEVRPEAAVTVVVASGGYPNDYASGLPITLPPAPEDVVVFHAGTAVRDGQLVTAGGRVLAVSATGANIGEARQKAYQFCEQVSFEGRIFRRDIAGSA